jgi:TRAP-type uncharacterized transport system fused permease subunit
MFILFGAFLLKSGAGDFMIQLARCLVGKLIGGPGLVAVFGSALMGSISNVTDGIANPVQLRKRYGRDCKSRPAKGKISL